MTLNAFFQISVSVFCITATLFILFLFTGVILLRLRLSRLINKLEEITEIAKTTAGDSKEFVERTIQSFEAFRNSVFTLEFVRRIIDEVIKPLINNSKKGARNGKEK